VRAFWKQLGVASLVAQVAACGGEVTTAATSSAKPSAVPVASGAPKPSAAPQPSTSASAQAEPAIEALPADAPLRIGVTLHPYFSWVKNVVGDVKGIDVVAVLPGDVDAGAYQPRPDDIKKLADIQALVVNGIGHDDFINDMLKASGNAKVVTIAANEGTPLLPGSHGEARNSHTFISFTNAIQQTYLIEKTLARLRPDQKEAFQKNADAYAKKLRAIKTTAADELAKAKVKRVVTVHDGYSYLCQEFGLEVAGVVQPAHGLTPSAKELGEMVELLKREKIEVVLTEEAFPKEMLKTLEEAGKIRVYVISHVAGGAYTGPLFEEVMKKNADTLVQALVKDG
jgi:zinc transport system substrate-binding protein